MSNISTDNLLIGCRVTWEKPIDEFTKEILEGHIVAAEVTERYSMVWLLDKDGNVVTKKVEKIKVNMEDFKRIFIKKQKDLISDVTERFEILDL